MILVLALLFAVPQEPYPVTGRLVRIVGKDTIAVSGAMVTLHRVRTDTQGPIDSVRTATGGRFDFTFKPDTGAVYLLSARWAGIEYFASPIIPASKSTEAVTLVVSDTSSSAPIQLVARHLIVSAPSADGVRNVIDLLVITNAGTMTRVSADSTKPTWSLHLPPLASNVHLGDTDFSNESLAITDNVLNVFAAIPPGQRDLTLQYEVPAQSKTFEIPVDVAVPTANLIAEEDQLKVDGGLVHSDSAVVDNGRHFTRWTGPLTAGRPIVLRLPSTGVPRWVLPALIAFFGIGIAGLTVLSMRKVLPR